MSVTQLGIFRAASPPRDTRSRFLERLETFRATAMEKIDKSSQQRNVKLTAKDIQLWRRRNVPPGSDV
ncbi:hypothetical protein HGP16_28345 [Rhizobium sp. P40RR-XXII]|uniref:hypothetical protein n=1 Tax=Rhizobium sp. P40RR-XXII TaxID=2726739 RepID=UPI00145770E6|nr:hypothetical protein [Rhizobium sp. P40RR-XXII]NLS20442.1 hypothetical protein [Rhizobium sp. P40RR-XXII]